MDLEIFYKQILKLEKNFKNRDLGDYLLALHQQISNHHSVSFDENLLLKIIQDSFTSESISFNSKWLEMHNSPELKDGAEYSLEVIQFQVAELKKMEGKQLEDDYRYFGIESETGNIWYNFDPMANLECGVRCMLDNNESFENLNWNFIGILLEKGRIYE